jgi:hypothetical protein
MSWFRNVFNKNAAENTNFPVTEIIPGFSYFPKAEALLSMPSPTMFDERDLSPIRVGKLSIAPWGDSNDLPQQIIERAEKSEVVSSNLLFNTQTGYGMGPKPFRRIVENNRIAGYEEILSGQEYDFFEDNDIELYFIEQLSDMNYFWNTFPELILNEKRNKIVSLQSKEAAFSRWTSIEKSGKIKHAYSPKWPDATEQNIVVSETLNEFNPFLDLTLRATQVSEPRFIYPVYMPSPGRPYYSNAPWWSIFNSGYYDHSVAIPALKNALLKNKLGVKFIIYVSPEYFKDIFDKEGIDVTNREKVRKRMELEKNNFSNFLTGEAGMGKALMTLKKTLPTGNGNAVDRYIEIVEIKNDFSGGELVPDMEEVNNVICYAMGVHPSLVGAVPGKNKGGFSGSDKRELFLIKQALMKPLIDRILRPFKLIKKFNKWDENSVVIVPEYVFTTLDKNSSGKELKTEN